MGTRKRASGPVQGSNGDGPLRRQQFWDGYLTFRSLGSVGREMAAGEESSRTLYSKVRGSSVDVSMLPQFAMQRSSARFSLRRMPHMTAEPLPWEERRQGEAPPTPPVEKLPPLVYTAPSPELPMPPPRTSFVPLPMFMRAHNFSVPDLDVHRGQGIGFHVELLKHTAEERSDGLERRESCGSASREGARCAYCTHHNIEVDRQTRVSRRSVKRLLKKSDDVLCAACGDALDAPFNPKGTGRELEVSARSSQTTPTSTLPPERRFRIETGNNTSRTATPASTVRDRKSVV